MIKCPKLHIATSVTNRILNIADGLPDQGSQALQTPSPQLPDSTRLGQALDLQIAQQTPGELPGIQATPDPGALAQGAPLLDTLLAPE